MNKKGFGVLLFILGILITILMFNRQHFQLENVKNINKLIQIFLNIYILLFGKMSFFISISLIIIGLFTYLTSDIKLKFHTSKVCAYICIFIFTSMYIISIDIKNPIPGKFIDVSRKILEYSFNGKSGGIFGGLFSMPFYNIVYSNEYKISLIILIVISIIILLKEFIGLTYELSIALLKYYKSDDYKRTVKVLKAKKIAEREEYIYQKNKRKEELKIKVIESRKNKLGFEIAKKPKENKFQKPRTYSQEELEQKKKEWIDKYAKLKSDDEIKKIVEEDNLSKIEKPDVVEEYDTVNINDYEVKTENEHANQITEKLYTIKKEDINNNQDEHESLDNEIYEDAIQTDEFDENIEKQEENNITVENMIEETLNKDINELVIDNYDYDENLKSSIDQIFIQKTMDSSKREEIEKYIKNNVSHLESVLKEFGIEAKVVDYRRGPTITRYELTIPKGIKVSKVTSLSDDIAMSLAAESIRIEAPIPGKNTIGIETPNKIKEPVHFSNIIRNEELDKGALNIILGKDIVGKDKIVDIAKMPHLLIAGQTGSGKSVAVNTLISTLITKKSEKEVRFIMVDPKMVELMPYNGIPHLLVPVIIDPKQAAVALKWAVNEMENRYKMLMEKGVRNIESYNQLGNIEKIPYIVVIIDELADLMMVAAGSVEESIARIAQKARAIGIHLVVATQRPSTDVITGMIKANLPSRISFALRSQIDSRIILDSMGAEKLLGQGDMLLLENGSSKLERIQGAYISDDEVIKLTTALKENRKVEYKEEILVETLEPEKDNEDPLLEEALRVIEEEGRSSISLLQRKLKVGFNRASRIHEQLKDKGLLEE